MLVILLIIIQRIEGREQEGERALKEVQKQRHRPLGGLIIAGASLALLFGIAILKARVR
jgi:prepilin signal peptidase PulO-like enzyme (type II secretory pathway)